MIIKIGNVVIDLVARDPIVLNHLIDEYSLLESNTPHLEADIRIIFKTDLSKNSVHMKFSARCRSYYIEYISSKEINVIVPYSNEGYDIFKVINPMFESRFDACLVDFSHNTFLGLLQMFLLKRQQTLFHASSLILPGHGNATIFFGLPQSGKSTLVEMLTNNHTGEIISEDFCVISALNNTVYSLPHKSRISTTLYDSIIQKSPSLVDHINRKICEVFHQKHLRRLPFIDIYSDHKICTEAEIGRIYILSRDGNKLYTEKCEREFFVTFCLRVLENEFSNFVGFRNLFELLPKIEGLVFDWPSMLEATKNQLVEIYSAVTCEILHIPIYSTTQEAYEKLVLFLTPRKE